MSDLKNTQVEDDLKLPQGTTLERPTQPEPGMIRYNTDTGETEYWDGVKWWPFGDANPEATGGTIVDTDIGGVPYRIHLFTNTGNSSFSVTKGGTVEYLIVAGGGSGGSRHAGGGGAGGVIIGTTTVTPQNYTIIVGAGGLGPFNEGTTNYIQGVNGDNSSAFGLIALGGGGGGRGFSAQPGNSGGSGGGAGENRNLIGGAATQPGSASGGFGNAGGNGNTTGTWNGGGGGGGAGGPGQNAQVRADPSGGNGGPGILSQITGNSVIYAGGGGGSTYGNSSSTSPTVKNHGVGGIGGGGNGGTANGGSGVNNTGGGGGGGSSNGDATGRGGNGGSGIVVVRYRRNKSTTTVPSRTVISTQPNNNTLYTDGLVLNLDAADVSSYLGTGSNWNDTSGRFNNGSLINTPTFNPNFGGYFSFNGTNEYVDLVSQNDAQTRMPTSYRNMTGAGTNPFSIEVWFRSTQRAGTTVFNGPHIIGRDNGDIHANLTFIQGRITWTFYDGSWKGLQPSRQIDDGQWHHIVYVNKSNVGDMYIDGVLEISNGESDTVPGNFFSPDFIARGYAGAAGYFRGDIAVVRFYDQSLNNNNVIQNFNSTRSRFGV